MKNCYCEAQHTPILSDSVQITKFSLLGNRAGEAFFTNIHYENLLGLNVSDTLFKALLEALDDFYADLGWRDRMKYRYSRGLRTFKLDCNKCKHKLVCISMLEVKRRFEAA